MSLLHTQKIKNLRRDGQGCRGYCGLAVGLVELVGAFRRLSTNVIATEERVHFVRCSRVTGYTEITRLVARHKMFFGSSKRVRCGLPTNRPEPDQRHQTYPSEGFFGNAGVEQGFGSRHVRADYKTLRRL